MAVSRRQSAISYALVEVASGHDHKESLETDSQLLKADSRLLSKKEKIYFMAVIVRIPTPLRRLTQNMAEVETEGADIEGVIENLEANYPGMKERLCDEGGNIRRFVNIYLNDEDIRFLDGKSTAVADGAEISIIPAIAGGRNQS